MKIHVVAMLAGLAVVGAACGDGGTPDPLETGGPLEMCVEEAPDCLDLVAETDDPVQASDGLDCDDDTRMVSIMEPPAGFSGYATPEEAVTAIAAATFVEGTPTNRSGDLWTIESDAGSAVALTRVALWQEGEPGWFAGEITTCG